MGTLIMFLILNFSIIYSAHTGKKCKERIERLETQAQEANTVINENGFQLFHCENNYNACESELKEVKTNDNRN